MASEARQPALAVVDLRAAFGAAARAGKPALVVDLRAAFGAAARAGKPALVVDLRAAFGAAARAGKPALAVDLRAAFGAAARAGKPALAVDPRAAFGAAARAGKPALAVDPRAAFGAAARAGKPALAVDPRAAFGAAARAGKPALAVDPRAAFGAAARAGKPALAVDPRAAFGAAARAGKPALAVDPRAAFGAAARAGKPALAVDPRAAFGAAARAGKPALAVDLRAAFGAAARAGKPALAVDLRAAFGAAARAGKPALAAVVAIGWMALALAVARPAFADGSAGSAAGSAAAGSAGSADGSAALLRRPLAVVAVGSAADPALGDLANRLAAALITNDQLEPVPDSTAVALREPFADEDERALADARTNLAAAQDEVAAFQFADAARSAMRAEAALLSATPRVAAELRGEVRVVHGIALLADRPADAAAEFVLAQQLAPALALDPARYLPEVVDAFAAARAHAATDERVVDVAGTGRVWIDGREVGAAPGAFSVTLGLHVVQLVGPTRLTRGREIDVRPAPVAVAAVDIDAAEAALAVRIHRARTALAGAVDAFARAGAMTALADLVLVDDALVLSRDATGVLVYEVWRRSAGFVAAGAHPIDGRPAAKLLDVVAPPRPKPVIVKRSYPIPFVPPPPRWKEPRYYVLGGLAALVIGAAVYALATHQGDVGFRDNIGTDGTWSGMGVPGGEPGARRR